MSYHLIRGLFLEARSFCAFVMLQACSLWEAISFLVTWLLVLQQTFPGSRERAALTLLTWVRLE